MLWFDPRYETFHAFSFMHGMTLLILIMLAIIIIRYRHRFHGRTDVVIRRSMVVIMILMEWLFYGWHVRTYGFNTNLLPLGVCAISMYGTSVALWTKNERVFQIIFPWAVIGALLSLIVADMPYAFPHFRFMHYFGNHGLFLLGNIYLLSVHKFAFTYLHLLKSSGVLFLYALIILPLNDWLDSNHLFLRTLPDGTEPIYAWLGLLWVGGFMFSILMLFHILYIPMYFLNRKRLR